MSSQKETMQVLPIWELSIPLPAVLMITLALYMLLLGIGLWIRYCLKDRCSPEFSGCCPDISICEECFRLGEMCDCRLPTMRSCLPSSCPSCPSCSSCSSCFCFRWDCACTFQPPECESCNCLCFEIRIK